MGTLPATFTSDPERRVRFEREARLLASLNHPNVATIHGIEHAHPIHALVLELVQGETLAARLRSARRRSSQGTQLPLPTVLSIARQIADALDAAHEKGVVHRDLKPANVMVRPDGVVKVLDFGLAKLAGGSEADAAPGATLSPVPTQPGTIVGTPAYMSPEQARGGPMDRRTDIWAFGCVLFEMLTGRTTFEGKTIPDTMAAVLEHEPDWAALPAGTPAPVKRLLVRCLQKDPRRRLQHIGDARIEIDDALADSPAEAVPLQHATRRGSYGWPVRVVTLVGVALAAAFAGYSARNQPAPREVRLDVTAPPTTDAASLAISPDGRQVAFVGLSDGLPRLWLRSLDTATARPLRGTENAKLPFWSPDGRSIGFSANGQLRRIDIESGFVQTLTIAEGGGTWIGTARSSSTRDREKTSSASPPPAASPRESPDWDRGETTTPGFPSSSQTNDTFCSPSRIGARDLRRPARGLRAAAPHPGRPGRGLRPAGTPVLRTPAQALAQAFDAGSFQLTGSPATVAEQVVRRIRSP